MCYFRSVLLTYFQELLRRVSELWCAQTAPEWQIKLVCIWLSSWKQWPRDVSQVWYREEEVQSPDVLVFFSPLRDEHYQCLLAAWFPSHYHPFSIRPYQGQKSPHTLPCQLKAGRNQGEGISLQPVIGTSKGPGKQRLKSAYPAPP